MSASHITKLESGQVTLIFMAVSINFPPASLVNLSENDEWVKLEELSLIDIPGEYSMHIF